MSERTRNVLMAVVIVASFAIVSGCTPDEEQSIRDTINSAVQNAGSQLVDFAAGFARQAFASFLL